jgi:TRAP-type mannitol/chloroaromatic compound transport system permease small subunit
MPTVMQAWYSGEMSSNAGGLIRWPVYAMMPLGFSLLLLQAVSELIKRVAIIAGIIPETEEAHHTPLPVE